MMAGQPRTATEQAGKWLERWLADQPGGRAPSWDAKTAGVAAGHSVRALQRAVRSGSGRLWWYSGGMPRRTFWILLPAGKGRGATGTAGGDLRRLPRSKWPSCTACGGLCEPDRHAKGLTCLTCRQEALPLEGK